MVFGFLSNLAVVFFRLCVCLCYGILSVHCSLVITFWERADLLNVLCVVFSCVFVTFPAEGYKAVRTG